MLDRDLKLIALGLTVIVSVYVGTAIAMPEELAAKIDECTTWQVEDLTISDEEFGKRMEVDCVDYAKYSDAETIQEYAAQEFPYWWGGNEN